MYYQTVVLCCVALASADQYQDALKKLWNKDSDSVIDVTSASIVIKPSSFQSRESRVPYTYQRYAFKPRAIPLRPEEPQVERNMYYADVKNKTNILFPGNYIPIAKEKSNLTDDGQFHVRAIPLIRREEYEKRSLDVEEPIIEKPEGFSEPTVSRRSLSYIMGDDDAEDEFEDDDRDYEEEEDATSIKGEGEERHKNKRKKIKPKKLKKYMLPLLLAYKMKYFALVPVMIAGLILLIGATGLAGFFFALFAAVMGLQKGGY
uniref:SFRICE_001829 n=1 Tax=Spodoptera frugiperda TaxID=7108 RepID=A0A2H1V298_SPOFR